MEAYVISGLGKGPRRHSVIIHQGEYTHLNAKVERTGQEWKELSLEPPITRFIIHYHGNFCLYWFVCLLLLLLKMIVSSGDCVPLIQLLWFSVS